MRLGIHVPEIAKTPATIGHVVYRGRLALYLGSSLSSLGMRLFVGQEEMDLCMWQLLPSICMLSVWRALKRHSECPCSTSGEEEDAT